MPAKRLTAVLGILFWAFMQILPASGQDPSRTDLAARFDAVAESFIATQQVPGALGAIVAGDEVILHGDTR